MALKQTLLMLDVLDHPKVNGEKVVQLFEQYEGVEASYQTVRGERGATDFVKIIIPGSEGKWNGGHAPTLGIIGRLGGIGARPKRIGLVSDGDGAVAGLTQAVRFSVEVAKEFGRGTAKFYDEDGFKLLNKLYGSMTHLQTLGVTMNE
ncbi:DUF1177 family protein [Lysinibacillus sp. FJAT-14745]|uniref:DUF1177 family protein n=1 Tax=Lysinibacillus sp. FJAT-14745 TaxID=1704289 RepID=UPI0006AB82FC|nr:DUF1177 family protein [Lysinibacillus sp. FJAT-14745]